MPSGGATFPANADMRLVRVPVDKTEAAAAAASALAKPQDVAILLNGQSQV